MLYEILVTARKEFRSFFASPSAYIFLGAFLAVTLFIFFWGESFFARNVADLRPMFKWMPVITVFLAGALTMRSWAEERRAGTFETLMSAPASPFSLVVGKFLAVEALVALALLLTLPLAFTVSFLGPLDWGPVVGGYIATLCLSASYLAIGLFVSAQSDNSVIALIATVLIALALYIIGSDSLMSFVNRDAAQILAAVGTGARFHAITRGVLDLRDLYYYLSIVGVFLTLNVLQIYRLRRVGNPWSERYRAIVLVSSLIVANFLVANLWMFSILGARLDLTSSQRYTLSEATHTTLARLDEPLLIRGYFSSQTHPLLAPLVPQIHDLLQEYALTGGEQVHVEFFNPTDDQSAEESAARVGIRPTPFQTASRYRSSVVSSYFDILISYGGENILLSFRDLVDVKSDGTDRFEVGLANPEYVLTSTVKKAMQAYRSGGDPFALVDGEVVFHGYLSSAEDMPDQLLSVRASLIEALEKIQASRDFTYEILDPDAGDGALAKQLVEIHGFSPQVISLSDPKPFWFSMTVSGGGRSAPIILSDSEPLETESFVAAIEKAVKRLSPGFLRTAALATPAPAAAERSPAPMALRTEPTYGQLREQLKGSVNLVEADLSTGSIVDDADVLVVLAPRVIGDKELFAIDQFLMRGGAVILATSNYRINMSSSLGANKEKSGLEDWLESYGIEIGASMVLDPESAALPIPIERSVSGYTFREVVMVPYPYFPDIRADGLAQDHPITASLGQLTMNWASPIEIRAVDGIKVKTLVWSSPYSWLSPDTDITPNYELSPETGFMSGEKRDSYTLAVAAEGRFLSAFAKKDSPLLVEMAEPSKMEENATSPQKEGTDERILETSETVMQSGTEEEENSGEVEGHHIIGKMVQSAEGAKLVVISSSNFASDIMLNLASRGTGSIYARPVDFLKNAIEWAVEDPSLLALRGKTQFVHSLRPISAGQQMSVEYISYAFAILGLALVWLWRRIVFSRDHARYVRILNKVKG